MNTETINTQLYEKMFAEQERYRDWLQHQPPGEILNHAYEYAIREDILMALESRDLSFMQAQMLIFTATPLAIFSRNLIIGKRITWMLYATAVKPVRMQC